MTKPIRSYPPAMRAEVVRRRLKEGGKQTEHQHTLGFLSAMDAYAHGEGRAEKIQVAADPNESLEIGLANTKRAKEQADAEPSNQA